MRKLALVHLENVQFPYITWSQFSQKASGTETTNNILKNVLEHSSNINLHSALGRSDDHCHFRWGIWGTKKWRELPEALQWIAASAGRRAGGAGGGLIPSLGLGPQDNFLVSCLSNISLLSVRPSFHLSFLPSVLPSFFPPPRLASDMWCEACCHSARLWWIKKKKGLFGFDTMLARLKVCWEGLGVLTCLRVEGLTRKIG